jgi:hypothetical protein
MPILLIRDDPRSRLETCSGVRETDEPCYRPGSLVPRGDWMPIEQADRITVWDWYESGKCLHENVALVRVIDGMVMSEASPLEPTLTGDRDRSEQDGAGSFTTNRTLSIGLEHSAPPQQGWPCDWRMALAQLDAVCRRLSADSPFEHKGRWLAKGGGTSLSTTWDRADGRLTGLHIDRWERRPVASFSYTRNRVCLNLGPRSRYLVFVPMDLLELAARCGIDRTGSFTTLHAQTYLRQNPMTRVYRLRVEPGEAYVAPTECLIHDGQASSADGEWVYTVFGRFESTNEARFLSVV